TSKKTLGFLLFFLSHSSLLLLPTDLHRRQAVVVRPLPPPHATVAPIDLIHRGPVPRAKKQISLAKFFAKTDSWRWI
ncbi:hypothetical protein U1Q18_046314, partial [Sarracenia purpurea var. burkii]